MPNVLITGAGAGIGRASALLLAERGWKVGAYDLKDHPHEALHTGVMDVTKPEDWEAGIADFEAHVGQIDVLVNNAGILYGGAFMKEGSFEKDSATVDVNLKGVLYGCRAAFPHLQPGAKIVMTSSIASLIPRGARAGKDQLLRADFMLGGLRSELYDRTL